MEDLIVLVILVVGGYIGWKILVAMIKGVGEAGNKISQEGPSFFGKVFQSMAAGIIGGIIISLSGAGTEYAGPGALGIAGIVLLKELVV